MKHSITHLTALLLAPPTVLYDAPGATLTSHMKRDVGLAWLVLPLVPPQTAQAK